MLILVVAIVAQLDPNVVYQNLDSARKQRAYMIYQEELRARRDIDKAIEATSKQMNMLPGGAIRLVIVELRRSAKIEEDEKAREKEKKANNVTGGVSQRPPRVSRPPRAPKASKTNKPVAISPKKSQSGDGVHEEGNSEEILYKQERYSPFGFRTQCRLVLPEDVGRVKELFPIAVDGRVKTTMKGATVVGLTSSGGEEQSPLVLVHSRSVKGVESLKRGQAVRVYGWVVRKENYRVVEGEEEVTADGRLFFAMDVDTDAVDLPGLSISPKVTVRESASSDKPTWDIEVGIKNEGERGLTNVILEANVLAEGAKPKKANDTSLFIVERLKPGASATLNASKESWVDPKAKDDFTTNNARPAEDAEEVDRPAVHVIVRTLSGKLEAE